MPTTCRSALAGQACTDTDCRFSHSVPVCDICNIVFVSQYAYEGHLHGRKHKTKAAGQSDTLVQCTLCNIHISSCNWSAHLRGSRHRSAAKGLGVSAAVQPEQPASDVPGFQFCITCNVHISNYQWAGHTQTKKHHLKLRFFNYQTAIEEAEKDKHEVSVSGGFDFGIVEPSDARTGITVNGTIQNNSPSSQVGLADFYLASSKGTQASSRFGVSIQGSNRLLTSRLSITFSVSVQQDHIGRADDRLDFIFEDTQLKTRFMITRCLRVIVGSKDDHELLKPRAPYKPRKRTTRVPETKVIEGVAPPALGAIPYIAILPQFTIPASIMNTLGNGSIQEIMRHVRQVHLPSVFNADTYGRHFKCLLWVEEFRMEQDLERYDIENALFRPHRTYYYLDVPGLAEKRPSVLVGDRILAQRPESTDSHWFEGRVHVVHKEEVGLRFHRSFSGQGGFRIRFKLNRYPMRRQHLGMDTAFTQDRVLFPRPDHLLTEGNYGTVSMGFKNPLIGTNPAQAQAVTSIVRQQPGSVPFLVFGPPGTGKTVTAVEAILQILHRDSNARILACAPSNSAADLIAIRLVALGSEALFRAYAPSRGKNQVPSELADYIYQNRDGHFSIPSMDKMQAFRVVVTTCVSAAMISGIGIRRGHYTHIFVDEAGQATEPEAMIAIKTMADRNTNIVLSGDPKQLGPIIRSSIARELGLEKSYMERLMDREIYDEVKGHGTCVVKLVKNFRSHSAILKFPSERFYKGDLQCCGDRSVIDTYIKSSHVGKPNFPIVFYAVVGKDDREASSPSFFNIDEVTQVKNVIDALRSDRKIRISDNDIGVIAPYHAQCQKIRIRLKNFADGVKVGSVEEFQGQERKVIIISTVRSSTEFVEYDLRHTLGFVASPRRFNVAVTRAQALLVIVGNPSVLSLDPLWRSFLNYIYNNGGWKGASPSWDTEIPVDEVGGYDRQVREAAENDMNELTRIMETLTTANVEEGEANIDRPWNGDIE